MFHFTFDHSVCWKNTLSDPVRVSFSDHQYRWRIFLKNCVNVCLQFLDPHVAWKVLGQNI